MHWALDVTFYEDASCIRSGDAPQNMGVLRHIALNLICQESSKGGVETKRFRAAKVLGTFAVALSVETVER